MNVRKGLIVFLGLACILACLSVAGPGHAAAIDAHLRVVHASPDAPSLDVLIDNSPTFRNTNYFTVSPYISITPGSYKLDVFATETNDNGTPLSSKQTALAASTSYTSVIYGLYNSPAKTTLLTFPDDTTLPAAGKARVRFIHASPDAPAVDVAVTNGSTLFTNIASGKASSYVEVDAGSYNLEVRPTGTANAVVKVPNTTFQAGQIYTVYAIGLVNGTGSEALTAQISLDTQGNATPVATTTAAVTPTTAAPTTTVGTIATTPRATTAVPTETVAPITTAPATTVSAPGLPETGAGGAAALSPSSDGNMSFPYILFIIAVGCALAGFIAVRARNTWR